MKKRHLERRLGQALCTAVAVCLLTGCAQGKSAGNIADEGEITTDTIQESDESADKTASGEDKVDIKTGVYKNEVCCHDPQIILAEDGKYYMTGSHQVLAQSDNLLDWSYIANGNNMFDNLFSGDLPAFSYVGKNEEGGYSVWASNIFYNEVMKKYVMYFCTTSSYIKSNLCMAVSDTPQGKYTYTDTILYSGFTKTTAQETNIYDVLGADADISRYLKYGSYDNTKWPNCIDPAVFTVADNRMWMVYGSWSGGIFLLELDPATGLPIFPEADEANGVDPYYGYKLIGGGHHAIEGPFIEYCEENGYYYLFVSYGGLTSDGGYQIRQYRSKNPTGPYVDPKGQTLSDEEDYMSYGLKMMGNYTLPSLSVTYMAPGGQSVFKDENGEYYITYHQRFDDGAEFHEPRVHKLFLTEDDWFTASVFELSGEELRDGAYTEDEIAGTYYLLNHGRDVSNVVQKYTEVTFDGGKITGSDAEGTYELSADKPYITITIDGDTYSGVIVDMVDEAGNNTRCISTVGSNNETIWAVRYLD
ncbi:glycoside hydrolase family 43 protein [Butyrivibrio sp. NC2002]|uniref:glycoside hydrolase family 43 protein n=1 Tax=Butyrivibrio sp. NC2002 TaxID=1410610 RepID=UPI00068DDCF3|nr:glycoside hydrolase family 43 protein [Butyrivibrio sp. NC2002]